MIKVPADVPKEFEEIYIKNLELVTHGGERLMLFAGDQKIEHLNDDFASPDASMEDQDPEHLFKIASQAKISCFASQLELIARYGKDYPNIPYVIKLNSKSDLVKVEDQDPISLSLVTMEQVKRFKEGNELNIVGVGYTIYLGSEFESQMLKEAQNAIFEAHQMGMFSIIWMYPRGHAVPNEKDPHLVAGAAGVAASIGTDFVKVNYPKAEGADAKKRAEDFAEAIRAAGRTKVICSGGAMMKPEDFFQQLHEQIHISGAAGCATGRNVHMRPLEEAIRFCNATSAIIFDNASAEEATKIFETK